MGGQVGIGDGGAGRLRFTLGDLVESDAANGPLEERPLGAVIKVVGVGGGGGNAINRMVAAGVEGVEFIAVNTDAQALGASRAHRKIQIGSRLTRGLGTGGDPQLGRDAALEDADRLRAALEGADMVFVTAGLGGGTGTGGSPVIAGLAAELDALVVAVVTKPFGFEGRRRRAQAEEGLVELKRAVDTAVTIPNDKLLHTVDRSMAVDDAFALADDVLRQAVQGISDLILTTGEINRDFADVRTVMKGMGMALMGSGVAEGENRAVEAAQQAISSPLLEDASIEGARGVIFNITGGDDLSLHEISDAASIIHDAADPDATIMLGYVRRPEMNSRVKVTVIATGFAADERPRRAEPRDHWAEERERWREDRERLLAGASPVPDDRSAPDSLPVINPPSQKSMLEDTTLFSDDGMLPHLDQERFDRSDFEIPAFLRRMQD